jgi:hypothetical protein
VLIEAEVGEGIVSSPLSKYHSYHTRICRPVGLSQEDRASVCHYAIERIGFDYDLRNLIDLMRVLMPLPVPQRWRRRMIALGSGNPTRIICSALIAQAFEVVRYPILPKITRIESKAVRREISQNRPSSHYAPRDFDRRISKSSNRPWWRISTTSSWIGPICRRNTPHAQIAGADRNKRSSSAFRRADTIRDRWCPTISCSGTTNQIDL